MIENNNKRNISESSAEEDEQPVAKRRGEASHINAGKATSNGEQTVTLNPFGEPAPAVPAGGPGRTSPTPACANKNNTQGEGHSDISGGSTNSDEVSKQSAQSPQSQAAPRNTGTTPKEQSTSAMDLDPEHERTQENEPEGSGSEDIDQDQNQDQDQDQDQERRSEDSHHHTDAILTMSSNPGVAAIVANTTAAAIRSEISPNTLEHVDVGPNGKSDIDFHLEQNWHSSYVRTRHKNLRCFPFCSPSHRERSFCGLPIILFVKCPSAQLARTLRLVGRFRKVRDGVLASVGDSAKQLQKSKNELIQAAFVQYNNGQGLFEFSPPRKWRYRCEQNKYTTSDLHTFTAYIIDENNICSQVKDSPHFRIVSAWRQSVDTVSRPYQPNTTPEQSFLNGQGAIGREIGRTAGNPTVTLHSPLHQTLAPAHAPSDLNARAVAISAAAEASERLLARQIADIQAARGFGGVFQHPPQRQQQQQTLAQRGPVTHPSQEALLQAHLARIFTHQQPELFQQLQRNMGSNLVQQQTHALPSNGNNASQPPTDNLASTGFFGVQPSQVPGGNNSNSSNYADSNSSSSMNNAYTRYLAGHSPWMERLQQQQHSQAHACSGAEAIGQTAREAVQPPLIVTPNDDSMARIYSAIAAAGPTITRNSDQTQATLLQNLMHLQQQLQQGQPQHQHQHQQQQNPHHQYHDGHNQI